MSFYDAKQPMPDRQLINLAQHRLDRTARGEATSEDFNQLRDIFPALLGRFRSMVEGEPVTATVLPFAGRLSPAGEPRAYLAARRS